MTKSGTHVLTAAVALLALVSPMAHGLDANATTYYASVAPSAFERLTPTTKPVPVAAEKKPRLQKKRKGSKAKILAGLNSFRSPARRALDRLEHSERDCRVGASACPAVVRNGRSHGQEWTHTALRRPATAADETPTEGAASDPGLARPHTDVPGLVPGRESSYKLSLNLPLGRHENVLLQANVRKNVYNAQNSSDSTLRADWSLRF